MPQSAGWSGPSLPTQGPLFVWGHHINIIPWYADDKLRQLDMPGRFFAIFHKGNNFCDFLLVFLHTNPILKMVYSKRKEFAPHVSKFFPFRVDPFSEEKQNI